MSERDEITSDASGVSICSVSFVPSSYDVLYSVDPNQERNRITHLTMKSALSLRAHLCCCMHIFQNISHALAEGDLTRVENAVADGLAIMSENEMLGMITKHLMLTDEELQHPNQAVLEKMFGAGRVRLIERE